MSIVGTDSIEFRAIPCHVVNHGKHEIRNTDRRKLARIFPIRAAEANASLAIDAQ